MKHLQPFTFQGDIEGTKTEVSTSRRSVFMAKMSGKTVGRLLSVFTQNSDLPVISLKSLKNLIVKVPCSDERAAGVNDITQQPLQFHRVVVILGWMRRNMRKWRK